MLDHLEKGNLMLKSLSRREGERRLHRDQVDLQQIKMRANSNLENNSSEIRRINTLTRTATFITMIDNMMTTM